MNNYKNLEKKIGIKFKDKKMLEQAFIHRSYINEHKNKMMESNERLEFLGDAVLELAATRHLFFKCKKQSEGEMTSFRSALVKGKHLAEVSKELGLGEYLFLSCGEEKSGGREKNYILANVMEALIGAIYLEHGYTISAEFIDKFIMAKLDEIVEHDLHIDPKSRFQEMCQEIEEITPHYQIIKEEGPDHDKQFTMGAYIGDKLIAEGEGSSKQKAEDEAARMALKIKKWE